MNEYNWLERYCIAVLLGAQRYCLVDHESCQIARSRDNVSADNQMLVYFLLIINLILTRVNLNSFRALEEVSRLSLSLYLKFCVFVLLATPLLQPPFHAPNSRHFASSPVRDRWRRACVILRRIGNENCVKCLSTRLHNSRPNKRF
jgi:hypothetical protein